VRRLKELAKLLHAQTRIADDAAHCECVDRVMARNCQDSYPIGHDDMRALTQNPKASLFQRGYGS